VGNDNGMDENDPNISKAMSGADVLRSLIASRSNSSERLQQDDVALAIAAVGEVAKASDKTNDRLEATALLGKVNEAFNSNTVTAAVRSTVERALVTPLPATGKWGNAEDRFGGAAVHPRVERTPGPGGISAAGDVLDRATQPRLVEDRAREIRTRFCCVAGRCRRRYHRRCLRDRRGSGRVRDLS